MFTFIENDLKNVLLLAIYFFQVCFASAFPGDIVIIHIAVNIQVAK